MKSCSACGTSSGHFYKGRNICNKCLAHKRAKLRAKASGKTDPKEHDYGMKEVPEGFAIKGVSQYLNSDGEIVGQWVKSVADKATQTEIMFTALREMAEGFKGIVEPTKKPVSKKLSKELLSFVPIADRHIGLHCWGEETGTDYDLKIASKQNKQAFCDLISAAPLTESIVLANLGDYFHADNSSNTTTRGTPVDIDGRRSKVVRVGLEIFVDNIQQALRKYAKVHVVCATGNHDAESSKMLALMLDLMFSREPRVTIDTSPTKFHKVRFGNCLLGITHGDTCKQSELPMIMANDWKRDWSSTEHRHWYLGHFHHDQLKEYTGGVKVETFRILAPADAWHTGQGYRSGRDIKIDIWHKEFGHVQRNTVGIGAILSRVKKGVKNGK